MIYLDNNATTPVLPEVFEAMRPYFCEQWGNPSSSYRFGSQVRTAVETAREHVAALIGAYAPEIIFTGCATESNNSAIRAALKSQPGKRHIVTSCVEHSSVMSYCKALEPEGCKITYLPVDSEGQLNLRDLEDVITDRTAVVSLMWANNETGVLFPVKQISEVCQKRGVLFHCDAVQAAGKLPINVRNTPVDYLSLSAHKFNGPKGVGAIYVNRRAPFKPFLLGGHQESQRRGGTENVPLIVGIGKAAQMAATRSSTYLQRVGALRDDFESRIISGSKGAEVNGGTAQRIANTSNLMFNDLDADALLLMLDQEGICASSGSACLADSDQPSHVITAMKPSKGTSRNSIRFSFSWQNGPKDVELAASAVIRTVANLRQLHS